VEIYNLQGKKVLSSNAVSKTMGQSLGAGTYLIVMKSNKGVAKQLWIKQ
jgi:hypothetical protein